LSHISDFDPQCESPKGSVWLEEKKEKGKKIAESNPWTWTNVSPNSCIGFHNFVSFLFFSQPNIPKGLRLGGKNYKGTSTVLGSNSQIDNGCVKKKRQHYWQKNGHVPAIVATEINRIILLY
jgi:hypothetical protein